MKVATILLAGALALTPALAQAQTINGTGTKPAHAGLLKAPRGTTATPAREDNDTDRMIDNELKRIDHMVNICTGC